MNYAGEIYVLVNPAFPNLVKIGYADDVIKRVKTLNRNSGLPDPYHIYATYKVKKRLEDLRLHKLIDSLDPALRHAKNKEFYEMPPQKAYEILSAIAQINGDEDLLVRNSEAGKDTPTDNTKKKRSRLTFAMLGIPVGAELVYKDDPTVVVKVADDKSGVEYKGVVYKLSVLVTHLKNGGSWQGGKYFMYNGTILTDLRYEKEGASL